MPIVSLFDNLGGVPRFLSGWVTKEISIKQNTQVINCSIGMTVTLTLTLWTMSLGDSHAFFIYFWNSHMAFIYIERSVIRKDKRWRWGRDSNPRYGLTYTHFPGVLLQPLGHLTNHSRTSFWIVAAIYNALSHNATKTAKKYEKRRKNLLPVIFTTLVAIKHQSY